MISFFSRTRRRNQRATTARQRRHQHLLDVKVRSQKATQQRNRKLLSWFCALVLIGTAAGSLVYGGREAVRRFVWENKDYQVSEVRIETDGGLTREQILAASGIATGTNIFRINIADARRSLLTLSQIESAEITRTLPNKIAIDITERKPVAWIAPRGVEDPSTSDQSFLADRNGVLMAKERNGPERLHLPVIYGAVLDGVKPGDAIETPEMKAALDLIRLNAENTSQFQVRSIDISRGYCMVVTDRNHAQITFGIDRLDWQLDRLGAVLNHVEQTKQELQTVNLMIERNVPVTFAPLPDPAREAQAELASKPPVPVKKSEVAKPANAGGKLVAGPSVKKPDTKSSVLKPFHKTAPPEKKKRSNSNSRNG